MPKKVKFKVKGQRTEVIPKTKEGIWAPPRRETIEKDQGKNKADDTPID
jgi:hypothetical protein